MNGKGKRTTLKNPPKIPNKNIPKDAPRIIDVNPIVGLKPKALLEISDWRLGVAIAPKAPPTSNPMMLKTIRRVPRLNPIKPNKNKEMLRRISIKFIYLS